MPNYVHLLFGYYLNMLLLVLHCISHLSVFTRGSRVIDAYNQAVQKNKYCSKIGECLQGTHVMCMYGNTEVMNPRCADGKILPLDDAERDLFLDIFNGFRRDLASGKEILGKDGIRLPQARNMRKLFWDNDLATYAQAWANQCQVRRNPCHSTDYYPRAGQMVGIVRFSYPDWSVPNQKFIGSGLSLERRKFAIEDFAKTVFSARKDVTLSMTDKHVGSGHGNVYLMSVYGSTSHIGCAMTTFVDYQMSFESKNDYYNAVILVCNFGSRPKQDKPIYMTNGTGPCSCFEGFKIENCLCVPGEDLNDHNDEKTEKLDKNEDITEKPNQKKEDTEKSDQKEEDTERPDQKDRTTENTEPKEVKTEKPIQEKTVDPDKNGDQESEFNNNRTKKTAIQNQYRSDPSASGKFRHKIKERIQNAKDQYLCSHGESPIFDATPVDQDPFLKSEFDPDYKKSKGNRKERDLELTFPKNLHNIRIKSKLDISDMNAQLSHNHQNVMEGKSRKNMAHRLFNDMRNTAAAKLYVTSVNGKPVKYPFKKFQRTQRLNKPLPYDVQDFSNQEPNVFISSINGKPVKFHYDDKFKKQQPSTRDLSYDDKGFHYRILPFMTISNNDHDQSISDLYAEEQKLTDMWYNNYIDEIVQKILRRTEEEITNNDNILINKQIEKNDLTKIIGSKVFATENIDPLNIDNGKKTVKTKIDIQPTRNKVMHKNLNQNAVISYNQEANRIFNDMANRAAGLNYKISPYTISNENRDQLLSSLLSQVQELKDIFYNNYVKEMDQKNLHATRDYVTKNENILKTKQINDLTDNTGSKVFAANINDAPNLYNEQKTNEAVIGNWPKKIQYHRGHSQTEEANQIFKDTKNTAAYVTFVNGNPVKYPFSNFEKPLTLNTKNMPYDEQGNNNQKPKIVITNDNSKPVKYNYDEKYRISKNPSIPDLSYDVGGLIYKKTLANVNLDQLLIDLYNEEQELKDVLFKTYIDEMEQKNLRTTGKENIKRDIIVTNKQTGKDNNNPFLIDNEQKTIKTQIDDWPTRNQVPLHIHAYGTDNFDYYRHFHATKEFIKPRATLKNNVNRNAHNNAKDESNGYNIEKNQYDYDVDKLMNYYLEILKDMQ